MSFSLEYTSTFDSQRNSITLLNDKMELSQLMLSEEQQRYATEKLKNDHLSRFNLITHQVILIYEAEDHSSLEKWRVLGNKAYTVLKKKKIDEIQINTQIETSAATYAFLEGFILSAYTFDKYITNAKTSPIHIVLSGSHTITDEVANTCKAVMWSRDLVNEPANKLNAQALSDAFLEISAETGIKTDVLEKKQIEGLKMGGLLHVNKGSVDPPTFSIMDYHPKTAVNDKPIILVGKGVVYDTGGLSLKPTPGSMDMMKCDMAGAAAVAGAVYALALNKIPLHVIALVPATDNRPGGNALAPGDIITMHNGKTVEVLNTDAEGRLILADALSFAQKYDPTLVIDLATLTGSAMRAIGHYGAVFMGTTDDETKNKLRSSGELTHERLVEFPFWDEYGKEIKSEIADIKNLGGPNAGAITAGKFLEHFTDYDWLHLDIAGPAFLTSADSYRGVGGTGYGVRLLYDFLKSYSYVNK